MRIDPSRRPAGDRLPRRGTDHLDDAAAWMLASLLVVLGVAAVAIGLGIHADAQQRSRTELAHRTEVRAILLQDAPVVTGDTGGQQIPVRVPARWTGPDGLSHTGAVPVARGTHAGSQVEAWVERDGTVTEAPIDAGAAVLVAAMCGIGVFGAGGLALAALWSAVLCATAAANARQWERDWARVEPRWRSAQL